MDDAISVTMKPLTKWIGFAACAWGLLFAAGHVLLFFGGGSFIVRPQFANNYGIYLLASTISVLLFISIAMLPLALVWPFRWISQRRLQILTLLLAYLALSSFAIYEWVIAAEQRAALLTALVCAISIVAAFVRPKSQSVARWLVFIATWVFGAGMALYGGAYLILAFFQPTFDKFLGYLFLGGMTFFVEGLLFLATGWLVSRKRVFARHFSQQV
ncbi:hypothetical protein [Cohnella lupini]|uniref:Uncharacterized protein n=1 Tax=Cohnella lupini TaxID=1294267 RepID=A0A3D9INH5_9BACL|nr:hypothetical protein [Cohnella lupini]RED63312.1 hypothetical protein DFP95_104307 [Cohnella lupini]